MSGRAWEPAPLALERAGIVLDVERLAYGESDVAERAYYDWLYRANPAGEGIIWYAATRDDPTTESAGHYAVVPVRMVVYGAPVTASIALNTLTHPRYRRQGTMVALAERVLDECTRRGIAFTYAFPNPSSYPGFVRRLGYRDIGRVPLLIAPLDARALAAPGAGRVRGPVLRAGVRALAGASRLVRRGAPPGTALVNEETAAAGVWDDLWDRLREKYAVMVVRDRAWVGWRFGACPTRRYRLWVGRLGGDPTGLLVTRTATILGMRAGLIVDFVVVPGEAGIATGRALVAAALEEFTGTGVALAAGLAPRAGEEYRCLRRAGFFPCPRPLEPQPFRVTLRPHAAAPPGLPQEVGAGWYLTMGDYDAV